MLYAMAIGLEHTGAPVFHTVSSPTAAARYMANGYQIYAQNFGNGWVTTSAPIGRENFFWVRCFTIKNTPTPHLLVVMHGDVWFLEPGADGITSQYFGTVGDVLWSMTDLQDSIPDQFVDEIIGLYGENYEYVQS